MLTISSNLQRTNLVSWPKTLLCLTLAYKNSPWFCYMARSGGTSSHRVSGMCVIVCVCVYVGNQASSVRVGSRPRGAPFRPQHCVQSLRSACGVPKPSHKTLRKKTILDILRIVLASEHPQHTYPPVTIQEQHYLIWNNGSRVSIGMSRQGKNQETWTIPCCLAKHSRTLELRQNSRSLFLQ